MNLNDIGSVASIVALVIVIFELLRSTYVKVSAYLKSKKEFEEKTLDFVASIPGSATTNTTRNDAAIWANHVLGTYRHAVYINRFSVLIHLIVGFIALYIFNQIGMAEAGQVLLGAGIASAAADAWVANKYQARVSSLEDKLLYVWGGKIK
ncbi:hypothetical protein [Teredinibacter turnerae]|uniref:hypothetical protein n=1 Tax=Teredinibacter turnerae TaxID=2426 RepID=UPI0030D4830C